MDVFKIIPFVFRLYLSLGMIFGYKEVVLKMAQAAFHAQKESQETFSVAKFNRMLWTGGSHTQIKKIKKAGHHE